MSGSVLVGYATRYGSTREVAEAIAATLREHGLEVDSQPLRQVSTLNGYQAIVLGAPLYIGSLHKDAGRFLSQYQEALATRPMAVFALGPTASPPNEAEWEGARQQLDQGLAKYPGLAPVERIVFGGRYDPARLGFVDKLIAGLPASPLHGLPSSDARDWAAIRAWAGSLAATLQPGRSRSGGAK